MKTKCLKFAEKKVQLSNDDKKIIYHARKSLLFNEEGTWMKKDGLFDVTMGAYDGAEVCELVGTFLLDKISEKYEKNNIGLYRDDGLSVFKNKSGIQLERIKKNLQKTFKDFGLEIIAESNLKIVNYLDVTLNLNNGSFKSYHKPDDIIQYINKESNHPPSIIEHLPASIEKRLSNNSSYEKIFKEAAIYYEDTLTKAGYINNLVYHTPSTSNQENKNKSRQRNVIWFNPPYSKSVATRIGQSFLHLIDTHFPKTHIFNKIFNRNKVKVSYSSMQGIINNHNMNILHQNNEIKDECNCRNKKYCPLGGKCLSPNIVYQGKINSSQPSYNEKVYFGVAEKSFKDRFYNHTKSFTHEDYANDTELSKEYLDIKRNNFIPEVTWSIVRECPPYSLSKRKCYLCLNEKLEINSYKGNNLLNKRLELINKCRYLNKHTLLRHDTKD